MLYRGESACDMINNKVNSLDTLVDFANSIDGVYSCVINLDDCVLSMVDRARSMPLFFDKSGKVVSDSAERIRTFLGIKSSDVAPDMYLALYSKSYILGNFTVYSEILQLDCGQVAVLSHAHAPEFKRYYSHMSNMIFNSSYDSLKNKLNTVSAEVFKRLKQVIAGRPVVLSLSGGYDSRFIACMLKRAGVDDVSCYTFGKIDSHEVLQSKRNAEALGYRWTCVEYTDELVKNSFLDEIGLKYLHSIDTHDYTGYLQNYPAVRYLHEHGWFKKDSVFITGSCGDMPTGYYIPEEDLNIEYTNQYAVEWLYGLIYARAFPNEDFHHKWVYYALEELKKADVDVKDYQSFVSSIDFFYTQTCHTRCFLHMNRPCDTYDYEWLIPFWDKELLNLFYSIPAKYRYRQKIYEDFLLNDVCKDYGIGQKKTVVGYSLNPIKRKLTYLGGSVLAWICFHLNIPFRRKYDFNNLAPFELGIYQLLECKKTVVWHKAAAVSLFKQFILQYRYGVDNMLHAKKKLIKY